MTRSFSLPYPVILLISCAIFLVIMLAFQRLGAPKWWAYWITALAFLAVAGLVQWLYW